MKEPTSWDSKLRDSKQGVCGGSSFLSSAYFMGKYSNLVWHMKISNIGHNLICSYKKKIFTSILPELLRFSQGSRSYLISAANPVLSQSECDTLSSHMSESRESGQLPCSRWPLSCPMLGAQPLSQELMWGWAVCPPGEGSLLLDARNGASPASQGGLPLPSSCIQKSCEGGLYKDYLLPQGMGPGNRE